VIGRLGRPEDVAAFGGVPGQPPFPDSPSGRICTSTAGYMEHIAF